MRPLAPLVFLLLLAGLALPAAAADTSRVGYLTLERAGIRLHNADARIEVTYALDPGTHLMIILFGTGDLQRKLEKALNFPSIRAEEVGLTRAVFLADGAAENYGEQAFWFPPHSFGVTFPRVTVEAPGYSLSYTQVRSIPKGFGYFGSMP